MSTADTALLVAGVACGLAVLLLMLAVYQSLQLRRIRAGQKLLLGSDQQDLVEYAVGLLARVEHVETRADDGRARAGPGGDRASTAACSGAACCGTMRWTAPGGGSRSRSHCSTPARTAS